MAVPGTGAGRSPSALRHVLFWFAGALTLLAVIVVTVLAIVLSGGANIGLIRDRVREALVERLGPDFDIAVGSAVTRADVAHGLVVDLGGIEVARHGAPVMEIPSATLAIDAMALIALKLRVTSATLTAPSITLTADDTGYHLGDGGLPDSPIELQSAASDAGFPELARAVQDFDRVLGGIVDGKATRGLDLTIADASLSLEREDGTLRSFEDIDLDARIGGEGEGLVAELFAGGAGGRWSARLERRIDPETRWRVISAKFSQLTVADVAPGLVRSSEDTASDIPLFGEVQLVVGDDGVRSATARLDVGAGLLHFGHDETDTILLDEAVLKAHWDADRGEIAIEPSSIHVGPTGGSFTGTIREEGSGRYLFAFVSRDTVLAPRDSVEAPLAADLVELAGSFELPSRTLSLDRIIVQTPGGNFAAAGRLGFDGETPSLALAAELSPMAIATWKQMWPAFVAPGARRWAFDNILGGRITAARFETSVPPGVLFRPEPPAVDAQSFRLDFQIEGAAVKTFGGLPPISGASGHAVLAGKTFGIDLDSGTVKTPGGATVRVDGGALTIDNVFDPSGDGMIEARLSGSAAAVGELANAEPFRVLARRGLVPSDLSGDADVAVSVRVPLEIDEAVATEEQIGWKVVVTATGLGSKRPVEGRTFRNADVTISADPSQVTINGTAEIDGVPASVSMSRPLDSTGGGTGAQAASLALDRAARERLGLDIEDIVSGTVDAQVRSLDGRAGDHYDLDLTRARLVIPGLGWSKGVGVPAKMSFDAVPEEGGTRIEMMTLSGDGFGFEGTASLRDGDGLVAADIVRFHLRRGDDISLMLRQKGESYAIIAEGSSFDVRGVIAELKGDVETGDGDTSDISLEARIGKLRGFNDRTVTDAVVSFETVGAVPRRLVATGRQKASTVSLNYVDDLSRASLEASAGDAGAILDFLDLYGRIGGGHVAIKGERPAATGPLTGTMSVTSFAILDEPAMREVVSRARSKKGAADVDLARMHVEQMDTVFRYTGDEIFVDEAFLRGAAMGATFSGVFDLAKGFVSMSGTYIPIYGINNVFSRVPVVGRILGGENAEGLIGVTFKVEGPIDGPRVFVNPLSAVAPGIFRKIFEYRR